MDNILIFDKHKGEGVDVDFVGGRVIIDRITSDDFE
jgi:hypothetical protein